MNIQHLVSMANEIAAFFDAEADKPHAAEQVAGHLRRYWEKRMRAQILAHESAGGAGLTPLARRALTLLR